MSGVVTLLPLTGAALTTAAVMYPVDVLRAQKMANASNPNFSIGKFVRESGIKAFTSQGIVPELAKSTVMRVSKFFFFPIMCEGIFNKPPPKCSPLEKGIAGAIATVPEIVAISPFEIAKLRAQLDKEGKFKNSMTLVFKDLYSTRGFSSLYSGWAGMQWRQSWWTGMYFATLNDWKKLVEPPIKEMGGGNGLANLVSGFVAGCVASIPNTPGDVVRSVVQRKMFEDPSRKPYGISPGGVMEHISVASEIVKARGVGGLWAGFGFKALHLGGSGAIMAWAVPMFSKLMNIPYSGV